MKKPTLAIGILTTVLLLAGAIFLLKKGPREEAPSQPATPTAKQSTVAAPLPEPPFESAEEKTRRTDALNAQVSRSLRFNQAEAKLVNDPTDRSQLSEDALLLDNPAVTEEEAQPALYSLLSSLRIIANGGNYPAGLNVEVTNALLGVNIRKIGLLPMDSARINENGELVDEYGTAYWFHSNHAKSITITSAGPDGLFETADDTTYPHS